MSDLMKGFKAIGMLFVGILIVGLVLLYLIPASARLDIPYRDIVGSARDYITIQSLEFNSETSVNIKILSKKSNVDLRYALYNRDGAKIDEGILRHPTIEAGVPAIATITSAQARLANKLEISASSSQASAQ
jgi:hypothetical protein